MNNKNDKNNNKPTSIKIVENKGRMRNLQTRKKNAKDEKIIAEYKSGKGNSHKKGRSDLTDALKCKSLAYYKPIAMQFTNCTLGDIQDYYRDIIFKIFGFTTFYFIDKKNCQKEISEMNFEKENLLEIIRFLKDCQNEI